MSSLKTVILFGHSLFISFFKDCNFMSFVERSGVILQKTVLVSPGVQLKQLFYQVSNQ